MIDKNEYIFHGRNFCRAFDQKLTILSLQYVQPISYFRGKNNDKRIALEVLVEMLSHQTFTYSKLSIKTLKHIFTPFLKRL